MLRHPLYAPERERSAGIIERVEDFLVQNLVAQTVVEALR